MKTAIIGLGVIGKVHLETLIMQGRTVSALCDIDAEEAKKAAERFGCDVPIFTDFRAMLDEISPDAVHVCTPHYLHAEMVIELLSRDINVLCEKPLCIKKSDIPRILEAEKKSKAILGVCHQNRYLDSVNFVKDYLKDKEVSSAHGSVIWKRGADYYNSAEWRGTKDKEGGGVLINQALHTLDLVQYLCGEPEYVTASADNLSLKGVIEVEDTISAVFDGKTPFTFFATIASPGDLPVEIKIKLKSKEILTLLPSAVIANGQYIEFPKKVIQTSGKPCYGSGHFYLFNDFYSCLAEGKHFAIDGEEGAKVVRMILSSYESKGEKIKISPSLKI